MKQEIKFPNKYNQCASFCEKAGCAFSGNCMFGFNRFSHGARELRLDFNLCNLHCRLCWSNNNDSSKNFSVDDVLQNFKACTSANHRYIYEIYKPGKPDTFKIQSLQIIGGEPLLSLERFEFIYEFMKRIDDLFREDFAYYSSCLKFDSKNRFRIKLFTNGITIGNGQISVSEIEKLNQLNHIRVDLLVSIKGFYEEAFHALQNDALDHGRSFEHQIACLEKLKSVGRRNLHVQPVLGFYHSNHFNIKTPDISAGKMFVFNESPLSKRLHHVLKYYIDNKYGFFVEPVHALGKSETEIAEFLQTHCLYLEKSDLVEPELKSNSKTNYGNTKLKYLFDTDHTV